MPLSTETSFGGPVTWNLLFSPAAGGWTSYDTFPSMVDDVNGDGKDDIVAFGANATFAWKSTAGLLVVQSWFYTNSRGWVSQNTYPRDLGNTDANGKLGLVGFGSDGTYVQLSP